MHQIHFIKGHMGGNRILLLDARQIPEGRELATALFALSDLGLCGHQVGLCRPGSAPDRIRVRVVSISWKDYIPACGGLTQVLGRALAEGVLAEAYGLEPGVDGGVDIEFDAWPARVRPAGELIETDLTAFARLCATRGVQALALEGVECMGAGTFLIVDAEEVKQRLADFDPERLDASDQALLLSLHKAFQQHTGEESWDFALYDWRGPAEAPLRVVFPHAIPIGHIEPACGTGTVALGLALAASGELERHGLLKDGAARLRCQTGGDLRLGGDEFTELDLRFDGRAPTEARLRHSRVELVGRGALLLPEEA